MLHTYLPVALAALPSILLGVMAWAFARSDKLSRLFADAASQNKRIDAVETAVRQMQSQMPETYTRREEWINWQSRTEQRLDKLWDELTKLMHRLPPA